MHWIDWVIVALPMLAVLWIGWITQRYVKGVSDFLAGGWVAGRYLLAVTRNGKNPDAVRARIQDPVRGPDEPYLHMCRKGFLIRGWIKFPAMVCRHEGAYESSDYWKGCGKS